MSNEYEFKQVEKPNFYSEGEWEEIQILKQKAKDKYVNLWIVRQATPYLMKEKIDPTDLEHVLDFFNSESPDKPPRLGKISYLEAVRQANRWTELENKRAKRKMEFKENPKDTKFIFQYEQDRWVQLITQDAYKREGVNMHHCVGNGGYQNSIIYSLRDEENEPHCTIEVSNGKVKQIKGKTNQLVVHRYHKSLFSFLAHLGIQIDSYDLEKYGFVLCREGNFDVNSLPDEVEILNNRKVTLGLNSRIPTKLKGANIEIESRKDLDLSQWEVSVLKIKTNNNKVKLPSSAKEISLENSMVKESDLNGTRLTLIDSSVCANEIKFDSCAIKNSLIDAKKCTFFQIKFTKVEGGLNKSRIKTDELFLAELSTKNEFLDGDIFSCLQTDKITIDHSFEMYYTKEMESIIKKIKLSPTAKIIIHNEKGIPLKMIWENVYQIELNGPFESLDLSHVKKLLAFKSQWNHETRFVIGQKIKGEPEPNNIMPVLLKQKHNLILETHYYEVIAPNKEVR